MGVIFVTHSTVTPSPAQATVFFLNSMTHYHSPTYRLFLTVLYLSFNNYHFSVQEVQEEGKHAIDSPGSPTAIDHPPEEYDLGKPPNSSFC